MKFFLKLLILISIFSCSQSDQNNPTTLTPSFIVGGHPVKPATIDTSFIVHFAGGCGGSIISEKWILTAAHCEVVFDSELSAGSIDLKANDRIILEVKNVYIHPEFKNYFWGSRNDFALIELETPIDFNKTKLSTISLATPEFASAGGINEGVKATALGWGLTSFNSDQSPAYSDVLMSMTVPIVGLERANDPKSYDGVIDQTMIAAGYDKGGKDSCGGDSGGPLIVTDIKTNKPVLAGVVSFGDGCGLAYKYGIYSSVPSASKWIRETMSRSF